MANCIFKMLTLLSISLHELQKYNCGRSIISKINCIKFALLYLFNKSKLIAKSIKITSMNYEYDR